MTDFYIKRLSITGPGKEPSIVNFSAGLNIIFGPSDTGKSYIAECIDYMFGAGKIRFDPNTGYDTFQLLISSKDGEVTLERRLGKTNFNVSSTRSDIAPGEYTTGWRKGSKKDDISDVWLRLMGIRENHEILKNSRREKIRLTLRLFSHIFLIKENSILQETSIFAPVQKTVEPASFSALYFLITGEDFSDSTPKEEKKVREARKNAVIDYINLQLKQFADKKTALLKLPSVDPVDLQAQVEQMIEELEKTEKQIALSADRSKSLLAEIYSLSDELAECNNLYNRYKALQTQYSADIQRIAFIVDGELHRHDMKGNTTCPFCDGKIATKNEQSYIEASKAELAKMRLQLEDLMLAETDLISKRSDLEEKMNDLTHEKSGVEDFINTQLKPRAAALKQSLNEYRYAIELRKETSIIDGLETALKNDLFEKMIDEEETNSDFRIKSYFDAVFFKSLDGYLNKILEVAKYVRLSSAYFNHSDFDVVVNGQAKMMHGKGYRAFLNTVMALALIEYLSAEGKYSPSMLIVDSPILSLEEGVDDKTPDSMKAGLFKYLLDNQSFSQVIIIENKIPPALDYSKANMIEFTKGKKPGRYGLLHDVQS